MSNKVETSRVVMGIGMSYVIEKKKLYIKIKINNIKYQKVIWIIIYYTTTKHKIKKKRLNHEFNVSINSALITSYCL